jgi:hypothetical protein
LVLRKADMDITSFSTAAFAVLCLGAVCALYWWRAPRGDTQRARPQHEDLALRDSAAFALSCYWARCHEGWSLVLFRDVAGVIRHVACETPDGAFFDARGSCSTDQIAKRLGLRVTASQGEESDIQPLVHANAAVMEAADELRQRVEQKAARPGVECTPPAPRPVNARSVRTARVHGSQSSPITSPGSPAHR